MKYLFAVNPASGKNKAMVRMKELEVLLKEHNFDYMVYETQPIPYANDLRQVILNNDITHVFAVGGDGTANEVLNAMIGLDVYFGVIPFGSGNDFARVLRLPKHIDKVFEMIKKNDFSIIDVGQVKDKYFLNYVSFGFDVDIVKQSIKFKKVLHSGVAYALAVVTTLFTYKCKHISINDHKEKMYLATIHNGKFYGGGMKINPFAEINDGILDCCTVKKLNKFKLLYLFPSVFSGKHFKYKKYVNFQSRRSFLIETNEKEISAGIDGEIVNLETPVHVNIVAESVKMIKY